MAINILWKFRQAKTRKIRQTHKAISLTYLNNEQGHSNIFETRLVARSPGSESALLPNHDIWFISFE